MKWHEGYRDRVLEDPLLENFEAPRLSDGLLRRFPTDQPLIGGFHRSAATQVAVWRRLIQSTFELEPLELWFGVEKAFLSSYAPRSHHERIFMAVVDRWDELSASDPAQSFAVFSHPRQGRIAFIGLPTEEGLDRIGSFLKNEPK